MAGHAKGRVADAAVEQHGGGIEGEERQDEADPRGRDDRRIGPHGPVPYQLDSQVWLSGDCHSAKNTCGASSWYGTRRPDVRPRRPEPSAYQRFKKRVPI